MASPAAGRGGVNTWGLFIAWSTWTPAAGLVVEPFAIGSGTGSRGRSCTGTSAVVTVRVVSSSPGTSASVTEQVPSAFLCCMYMSLFELAISSYPSPVSYTTNSLGRTAAADGWQFSHGFSALASTWTIGCDRNTGSDGCGGGGASWASAEFSLAASPAGPSPSGASSPRAMRGRCSVAAVSSASSVLRGVGRSGSGASSGGGSWTGQKRGFPVELRAKPVSLSWHMATVPTSRSKTYEPMTGPIEAATRDRPSVSCGGMGGSGSGG
mmetsp:Transcript_28715/g.68533  ORF Transcript_28715/g.68533 Transcript_28715/m.68533 type:complete len:267 (+) Transcript_28715:1224-2024(+)